MALVKHNRGQPIIRFGQHIYMRMFEILLFVLLILAIIIMDSKDKNFLDSITPVEFTPDIYARNDYSINMRPDGSFVEDAGSSAMQGRWENDHGDINLVYQNGSQRKLCLLFFSDRLMPVTPDCPCILEVVSMDECVAKSLIRKGLLGQTSN